MFKVNVLDPSTLELHRAHPVKTEQRVGVFVPPEDGVEVLAAGREDDPVGRHLVVVSTHQAHVREIFVLSQGAKCLGNI